MEKVVSAPKNPVIKRAFWVGEMIFSKYIAKKPIKKLPITFTLKVPKGKSKELSFWIKLDIKNLLIAPKNPPIPTAKMIFIFIFCLLVMLSYEL